MDKPSSSATIKAFMSVCCSWDDLGVVCLMCVIGNLSLHVHVVSSGMRPRLRPQTGAESSYRTAPPPLPDRCNQTSFAAGEHSASPSADRPDDRHHLSSNAVRSASSAPSTARPDSSRSGTVLCGSAYACRLFGIGEDHLLHRKTRLVESGYFAKLWKFSSECPKGRP